MQLLMLKFTDPRQAEPAPVFSQELGVLSALLQAEGITSRLLLLGGYRPEQLHQAVVRHRPQYVLVEMDPFSVTAAHRTIVDVASHYHLPVAVCGRYATCRPAEAVSVPGVEALLLGEFEQTAVELLRAWRSGQDAAGIAGAWVQTEQGLVKGALRPPINDLDSLPRCDRELLNCRRMVEATGEVHFRVARGCPHWCAYCVNDWYIDLYSPDSAEPAPGALVRRRSPGNVMDEIAAVVPQYGEARSVAILDHCFATDEDWLATFSQGYPRRCALPYRCHVRLNCLTERIAGMLAASNCRHVHAHVGSGSRFIREEILSMPMSSEQILGGCRTLRAAGVHVSASAFVGCPYESEITIEETLDLLRRAGVDEVRAKVFYPVPGSRAAELCAENGWISGRGEEYFWLARSVLDMPSMPAGQINAVVEKFDSLLRRPDHTDLRKMLRKVRQSRKDSVLGLDGKKRK